MQNKDFNDVNLKNEESNKDSLETMYEEFKENIFKICKDSDNNSDSGNINPPEIKKEKKEDDNILGL